MSFDAHDRQTAALHRLLKEAGRGGQAKVDALLALSQRTVFASPWLHGIAGFRTLASEDGTVALPVFTERVYLQETAHRYGWVGSDGRIPSVEIGARKAFLEVQSGVVGFVVVDIGREHALELSRDELEPLFEGSPDSAGPFAGAGRVSSSLMERVRATKPPSGEYKLEILTPLSDPPSSLFGSIHPQSVPLPFESTHAASDASDSQAAATAPPPMVTSTLPSPPINTSTSPSPPMVTSTSPPTERSPSSPWLTPMRRAPSDTPSSEFAIDLPSGEHLRSLSHPPPEEVLHALESILREFPEVEWACLGAGDRTMIVGLRVDPRVRQRVWELRERLTSQAEAPIEEVILLDEPQRLRQARRDGFVFYPWRRTSSRG